MRVWTRAEQERLCGGCGKHILPGEPLLLITLDSHKGVGAKRRCQHCESAPPDLPLLVVKDVNETGRTMDRRPLQPIAKMLPLDWKARALGADREPGQEG